MPFPSEVVRVRCATVSYKCHFPGQDQGKRSAGQEEGRAAQAAGRPEERALPAPCGEGYRRSRVQALQDVSNVTHGTKMILPLGTLSSQLFLVIIVRTLI